MDPHLDRDPDEPERYEGAAGMVNAGADLTGIPVGDLTSRFGRDMRRMVWWAMGIATVVVIINLQGDEPTEATPFAIAFLWIFNVLIWMTLLAIGIHFARRLRETQDR